MRNLFEVAVDCWAERVTRSAPAQEQIKANTENTRQRLHASDGIAPYNTENLARMRDSFSVD